MRHRLILKLFPAGLEKGTRWWHWERSSVSKGKKSWHAAMRQNDWNMLEMAGLPVVMANADEETKKKAAFITKSNEEDGVAYAVEQFVLKNG